MNITWHMRTVKYPLAREVIDLLAQQGVSVRHLGGPALDSWRPPHFCYHFNCLDLLVREEDYTRFQQVMQDGGYRLIVDRPDTWQVVEMDHVPPSPAGPGPSYSRAVRFPSDLWIRFHTTWRHSVLLLADLAEWFGPGCETVPVMEGSRTIERPPKWAMMLWYAGQLTAAAASFAVSREDGANLYAIVRSFSDADWHTALDKADRYDHEYTERVRRSPADGWIRAYAAGSRQVEAAERSYGALYDLRHALEAVALYDESAVPGWVLDHVRRTGTGAADRKVYWYPDVHRGDQVAPPGSEGSLGIARPGFTIAQQLLRFEANPDLTWADLTGPPNAVVQEIRTGAPPHGPWAGCEEDDLPVIFAPVPP